MATAEQIKSLVKACVEGDSDRLKTVVLQIAAHEARLSHAVLARELKSLAGKIGTRLGKVVHLSPPNPMLELNMPSHRLSELIVDEEIFARIKRIMSEYRNRKKLHSYGLSNRRKILIEGAPGTGKTFTAYVIASELSLPLYIVQMDKLVTKFMGETSVKLRQVFDDIAAIGGVYLFDEFDAIGADRSLDNEVGEMRRVLNSFLQFLEQDGSESVIIAATNNSKILDNALFRRFDEVLHYPLPTDSEIERLFAQRLKSFDCGFAISPHLLDAAAGLNHAEIARVCENAVKDSILSEKPLTVSRVIELIAERRAIYQKMEA